MNVQRAIAIAITALLLIGLIGAATVTAKDYSLSSKKIPPGQTTKPTTAVTTVATPTVRATSPITDPITETGQTPFNGPHAIPGRIQAEDYDNGGAGIAYYDTTAGNTGGSDRLNEAVDVRTISGITDIAYIYDNEWTEYTVTAATSGTYTANFRVGSTKAGHTVVVTVDGTAGCTVNVPITGNYSVYATASAPLNLAAGTHVIRLNYRNTLDPTISQSIDWFEIVSASVTTTPVPTATTPVPTTTTPTPTTVPPTAYTTIDPAMSSTQATSMVAAARSAGSAQLASMQAAAHAWTVPARAVPAGAVNAQLRGLKADSVTDNTAALQALLNSVAAGSTIYFPKGTYKINGPISITKPVTMFGESGTIFNCQGATQYVFNINKAGSASAPMSGVTFTGMVIEGPGVETAPAMIYGRYLQNFKVTDVKIHNVGYAGVRIDTCTDVLIEHCVFDNIFKTGYGYSVCICDHSDRVTIRNNYFLTQGRHYVTTGTSNSNLAVADYVRNVLIENNYFEYSTRGAVDTHPQTTGPFVVKNNVFNKCTRAVSLRGGATEITDNVVFGSTTAGFYVYETTSAPTTATAVNKILRNKVFDSAVGVAVLVSNDLVQDNIISGSGTNGVWIRSDYWAPGQVSVARNIFKGYTTPVKIVVSYPGITQTSNIKL